MHPAFNAIVDYAGLFPPAACAMDDAVARYADYRQSSDRAMLGRFVVGAGRLAELAEAVAALGPAAPTADAPWGLSVVVGEDHGGALEAIVALGTGGALRVEALEARIDTPASVPVVAGRLAGPWELFLEVPHLSDYAPLLEAIQASGAQAKLRTGGVTAEAFPSAPVVARFLATAVRLAVPFKATAGLHHPWRGHYPLTYAPDAPRAAMFGFVAVLLATAALRGGAEESVAQAILDDEDPAAFAPEPGGMRWREMSFAAGELETARRLSFRGFGSCSFREPVDELTQEVGT